ncbi:MAG: indolepyruvate ferredoxin oxidoreductase family protein [Sphingomonadaceae bacterium]|nr:indolepyruvate ferredoxin oxidoreductase family protein [Sphingomonadaceae bacterium]
MNAIISLDDKYSLESGPALMNGTQALVRLTMLQAERDRRAGLDTAGYVTGYRGSPLGAVDSSFAAARRFTDPLDILVQPGVNEDLAATAIIGTQQVGLYGSARKQGVFALWYGKGPGVDRSGDALHHGNAYGSSAHGGVLVCAGDDHVAKSSTTAHQSEFALASALIPVLHPATLDEIIDFGLLGWAMSRYSGLWVGLKLVTDLVDSAGIVTIDPGRPLLVEPRFDMPSGGLNIRAEFNPQEQERRLHEHKIPAALAFAAANRIDRVTHDSPQRRLGIVTTGKSWRDTLQALRDLGIGDDRARELGISVFKVGMSWPIEPGAISRFATGQHELMVIEEKRPLIEDQLKALLFNLPAGDRPRIIGKQDSENAQLLPSHGELTPLMIARAIGARLLPVIEDGELLRRIASLSTIDPDRLATLSPLRRLPYFCSGCPHNSSTQVPEGSRAIAGIGCHGMAQTMDRNTETFVQMGGEGANWIGQAPFVETPHVFQNLGDGTYFHSGLLAVRAAVSAGVNITYKILYNDAVAMTGGQAVDGALTPQSVAAQVRAEGIKRIAVVSDDIVKYRDQPPFPDGVTIDHRTELDRVQRELRDTPGVTVLIYDQVCATEKRRRRKRKLMAPSDRRVLINDLVCEGCGDCSVKSNCLSVVPLETEFGTKRTIDQSSCNTDLSCLQGFCPSFVTVTGGTLRTTAAADLAAIDAVMLPEPDFVHETASILVTGIGGTGVVTIGAILAMAAHLDGKAGATLDMTGLAQKGGQVTSHVRLAAGTAGIAAVKLGAGQADLMLGADIVSSASKDALMVLAPGRTRVILNSEETITGAFVGNPDFRIPGGELTSIIKGLAGREQIATLAATAIARRLLGDALGANMLLVGYAWQDGQLPLSEAAILRAIELNGTAVAMNKSAFRVGRVARFSPDALAAPTNGDRPASGRPQLERSASLDEVIARRVALLAEYQDRRLADRFSAVMEQVRGAETHAIGREGEFSMAVARGLFKLMAYKDEYEVARLWTRPEFQAQLGEAYERPGRLDIYLAPPLLARRDPVSGEPRKIRFGPWILPVFSILARFKGLRGTPFDPFGYTAERRMERRLIGAYQAMIDELSRDLTGNNYARAVRLAASADQIRGYGHIKQRNARDVEAGWARRSHSATTRESDPVEPTLATAGAAAS